MVFQIIADPYSNPTVPMAGWMRTSVARATRVEQFGVEAVVELHHLTNVEPPPLPAPVGGPQSASRLSTGPSPRTVTPIMPRLLGPNPFFEGRGDRDGADQRRHHGDQCHERKPTLA